MWRFQSDSFVGGYRIIVIQYDIFGNIVPQKLCKCGCGEPVYGDNDYIHGHI